MLRFSRTFHLKGGRYDHFTDPRDSWKPTRTGSSNARLNSLPQGTKLFAREKNEKYLPKRLMHQNSNPPKYASKRDAPNHVKSPASILREEKLTISLGSLRRENIRKTRSSSFQFTAVNTSKILFCRNNIIFLPKRQKIHFSKTNQLYSVPYRTTRF